MLLIPLRVMCCCRFQLDDSEYVPEGTQLSLPPRNYILVHESGKLHKKDKFEPMSFGVHLSLPSPSPPITPASPCAKPYSTLIPLPNLAGMQRVHYESEPEPIWVQTRTARWIQSTTEVRCCLRLPCAVCCSPPTAYHLPCAACHLPLATYRLLPHTALASWESARLLAAFFLPCVLRVHFLRVLFRW